MDFDTAFSKFISNAQKIIDEHYKSTVPSLSPPKLSFERGRRYLRVIRNDSMGRSVHCFVEIGTGAILKAESWKRPARGVRGNIFDTDHGMSAMTPYGAAYLR